MSDASPSKFGKLGLVTLFSPFSHYDVTFLITSQHLANIVVTVASYTDQKEWKINLTSVASDRR